MNLIEFLVTIFYVAIAALIATGVVKFAGTLLGWF